MNISIEDILGIPLIHAGYAGPDDLTRIPIRGFIIDSREVIPGDVFIALKGERFDGHDFIRNVFEHGASAAIVNRDWAKKHGGEYPLIIVDDTLKALQEIAHYHRKRFSIPVIGLTGSNGKTTTKEMVSVVLAQKWQVLKTSGNLNNHIGVPLTLLNLEANHEIAIIEMGTNHFGEIARLAEIASPTAGLITNVGPAHLEFFGSLEGVARAKIELFDFLKENSGTLFVNVDDLFLQKYDPGRLATRITYGFESNADIIGAYLGSDEQGCPRIEVAGHQVQLHVAGVHNIYNALAAIAVGQKFDVPMEQICRALESFRAASKRMEIVRIANGLRIINDCYNANLASMEQALKTLTGMETNGKRVAVLADMLELGKLSQPHHEQVGRQAAELGVDVLFAYGPESQAMVTAAQDTGHIDARHFDDKEQLIATLLSMVTPDDLVLIKGSRGMAMEEVTRALVENEQ